MYSKFENLDEEKKKRIITASIEEFSQNGYKNASTNNIVRSAEISKGILFHYFGNKKSLFLYVFDYVINFLSDILYSRMKELPTDFFDRMLEIGIIKLRAAHEYPVEYRFIIESVTHTPEELMQDVQGRYEKMLKEGMPIILNELDTSNFRKNIDKNKAMELISLAIEGISKRYMTKFQNKSVDDIMANLELMVNEVREYIEILKYGVYELK